MYTFHWLSPSFSLFKCHVPLPSLISEIITLFSFSFPLSPLVHSAPYSMSPSRSTVFPLPSAISNLSHFYFALLTASPNRHPLPQCRRSSWTRRAVSLTCRCRRATTWGWCVTPRASQNLSSAGPARTVCCLRLAEVAKVCVVFFFLWFSAQLL